MVTSDWAKAGPDDLCLRIDVHNRSDHPVSIHVLPTAWFRNTWSWDLPAADKPVLWADGDVLCGRHAALGDLRVVSAADGDGGRPRADGGDGVPHADDDAAGRTLFCENETNVGRLYGTSHWAGQPATPFPKDGIGDHVVRGADTVNPQRVGTKAAFHHVLAIPAGEHRQARVRLTLGDATGSLGTDFASVLATREHESDEFWRGVTGTLPADRAHVVRQALTGVLSSKQYYEYDVRQWLAGDPAQPPPARGHESIRNTGWRHLSASDLIAMPDPWEYPWFAAWDLAFHCIALAFVDPALAKEQLLLLLREWYMHPSGDLPAYEWNFSDTNPPVHAWAALQIFAITGGTDTAFLERVLHKLLLNFTWWVGRNDADGNNLFEGGFLGLDNIGAFDRSADLADGLIREQSDGTAWMAMYCLDLMRMATVLAQTDHTYDDLAVKFLDHFCYIADAANRRGLWDEQERFFYDQVREPDGRVTPLRIRSVVGLIPVAAATGLSPDLLAGVPGLAHRVQWLRAHRPDER